MAAPSSIAHYRLTAKIGEGGMGAVYRATDTKLQRDVAVKVLPESFADDSERLARFTREAQMLAAVNHPNIAAIYGVEDRAIILELIEGPDVAGPLTEEQALPLIHQLIDALEYAHDKGIIHRDLKPANLKLTPDGRLKVLDFGLAKALATDTVRAASDSANSPTLSLQATAAGVILGSAAYMSPEQARGLALDKRSDIWSFGVVVYELLTGRRLFEGETVSDTLAAVLKTDPDLSAVPQRFQRLLQLCLRRDPRHRLRDISGARLLLEDAIPAAPAMPPVTKWPWLPWLVATVALLAAAGAYYLPRSGASPVTAKLRRFSITPPGLEPQLFHMPVVALSPDGERVAWVAGPKLWIRHLSEDEAREVDGPVDPSSPVWSPDGRFLACWANGQIWKIAADGTGAVAIQDFTFLRSMAWTSDGRALLVTGGLSIASVSVEGGNRRAFKLQGRQNISSLHALPGEKRALFHNWTNGAMSTLDLETGEVRNTEIRGTSAVYRDGMLIYANRSRNWVSDLWAVPFDPVQGKATGSPALLLRGADHPSVAADGTLVYVDATWSEIVRRDRSGVEKGRVGLPISESLDFAVSRDGRKVAAVIPDDQGADLWIVEDGRKTRITNDPEAESAPVWSPDGDSIIWKSGDKVFRARASRTQAESIPTPPQFLPNQWSPDGKFLLGTLPSGITYLHEGSTKQPWEQISLLESRQELQYRYPEVSPAGSYYAHYTLISNEPHIFVRPFPVGAQYWQISTAPSRQLHWSADGRELFFLSGNHMMSSTIRTQPSFQAGIPQRLFPLKASQGSITNRVQWAPLADGTFAMLEPAPLKAGASFSIHVVQNWKQLLPAQQ